MRASSGSLRSILRFAEHLPLENQQRITPQNHVDVDLDSVRNGGGLG